MRRAVLLVTTAGALGALTACGPASTTATSAPTSAPVVVSSSAAAPSSESLPTVATAPTTAAPSSASFAPFVMPRLVGMDLQSAQNAVQTHGIFYSRSHDLRGVRHQVLDSDWIVCTQNIPAGHQVTSDIEGQIDFGVVKRIERCP